MAITIHDVTHGGSIYFAAVYAALRLVIVLLYVWAWRTVPQSRELTARYSLSFSIALVIWCISLFTPEPLRFVLWAAALLIEIGNGPLTYATIKHVPQQVSHMDERFGLFVILVLGEAVIAVATGVSGTTWLLPTLLTAVAGFIFAACSWWLYFARADASVINQALRSNRRGLLRSYVYGYSHFFVFVGITAAGVGIQTAIESAPTQALGVVERAVLCGGAATFLLGISVVQWATPQSLSRSSFGARMVGVAACALLILVGDAWSPLALMALVALILAGLVAFDVIYANRSLEQPLEHEQSIESEAV